LELDLGFFLLKSRSARSLLFILPPSQMRRSFSLSFPGDFWEIEDDDWFLGLLLLLRFYCWAFSKR
jgi:hypothetical protein